MQLRELMSSPPIFLYPETPIWRAARAMADNDCSFLPIVKQGIPVGVVTLRDLTTTIALKSLSPISTTLADVMNSPAIGLTTEDDVEDASILMRQRNIHRLVVTDDRGLLRGVVSLGDLAGSLTEGSILTTMQRLTENSGPDLSPTRSSWLPSAAVA